jgi:hypothetical protein
MPYHVGGKGSNGCGGYPVVKEGGEVVGCHATRAEADAHLQALYANVPDAEKSAVAGATPSFTVDPKYPQVGTKQPQQGYGGRRSRDVTSGNVRSSYAPRPKKTGRGRHSYSSDPASAGTVQSGGGGGSMGSKSNDISDLIKEQGPCWDGYAQRGMKPGKNGQMVPNCVPVKKMFDLWEDDDTVVYESESVTKADGYSPPAGARAAARRAIKFKEDGKATGAGTSVGWTRAGQLARGETLSLSTVKRMYSYFSRHEVDKKGKDWANQSNPSNGYIMWLAWGGDAGFSWARGIVEREKQKMDNDVWDGSAFAMNKNNKEVMGCTPDSIMCMDYNCKMCAPKR